MSRRPELEDSIVSAVRRMSEGRDVAIAFSGGLDSGLVAGLAARYARSVHLYTCGTANAYDVVAADELSKRLGLPWTHVKLTTGNIGQLIVELMSATGVTDPFTVSYELQLFSVCRECPEDVVLTGQGADEYFMGCAKFVGRTPEAYDSLVRAGKDRLREVSIPCELAIASHFSKDLRYPYMDPEVIAQAEALDPEERIPLVTELSIAVNERCPFVPLYMKNNTRAYKTDLQGFNCNAGGTTYYELFSWN